MLDKSEDYFNNHIEISLGNMCVCKHTHMCMLNLYFLYIGDHFPVFFGDIILLISKCIPEEMKVHHGLIRTNTHYFGSSSK